MPSKSAWIERNSFVLRNIFLLKCLTEWTTFQSFRNRRNGNPPFCNMLCWIYFHLFHTIWKCWWVWFTLIDLQILTCSLCIYRGHPIVHSGIWKYWFCFYTPVFRRVVLWYGDVCPSVHRSVRPGLRPSVTVFRTFLLHALRYWAEILHVTFFLWTFDQVRVSSISINFCRSYAPFGT